MATHWCLACAVLYSLLGSTMGTNSTPTSLLPLLEDLTHDTPPPDKQPLPIFYSYMCNADTFSPSLTSVSSIWAMMSVTLVIIASTLYLMYVCFNKFVTTMLND
ncbi:ORF47 [callitrichine gammaherpesvirus 3]|uniref:ORF47 n=1 Tax=callitrichine gammaherpesvirus 3 TaxID=106331 RepID=Q993G2_9GAMA|nr:ORF47 [callitrichine gammaherpesvirus 3]AAK38256.1 ORF47 [callitrichine gammaherpesvirus 3]